MKRPLLKSRHILDGMVILNCLKCDTEIQTEFTWSSELLWTRCRTCGFHRREIWLGERLLHFILQFVQRRWQFLSQSFPANFRQNRRFPQNIVRGFREMSISALKFRNTAKNIKYHEIFFFRQWVILNFLHFVFNVILSYVMGVCVFRIVTSLRHRWRQRLPAVNFLVCKHFHGRGSSIETR